MAHALTLLRSGWGWFRNWRRTRPFWGGAVLIAAGIELLVAPAAQSLILPIDLIVYAGIAGISGPLIAGLLITLGVLSWLQPAQHVFFGLVGLMLALVSFVTSNFGGFVIGMLLGIVGGALVFAWAPVVRRRSRGRRRAGASAPEGDSGTDDDRSDGPEDSADSEAKDSDDSVGDSPDTRTGAHAGPRREEPADDGTATETVEPASEPRGTTRHLAAIALPLAAAVTLASAPAPAAGWPWDWFFPGDDEEQSEEQPSEEPSDEASEEPGETDPDEAGPEDPDDEDTEDGSDQDEEEPEEDEGDEEGNPEECELRVGDAAVVEDEEDFLDAVLACQAAQEEDEYPEVLVDSDYDCFRGSVRDSGLTADSLTMYGARYRGVVECPTADGPQRYIKLSMSSGDIRGGELWFDDLGTRRSLGLPTMNMTGDVEMHVTRMHVAILGIPLTFTPDFPPPLLLPFMYVTGVDVDNPMASTDVMTIPDLNGQYGGGA
ncbi:DUF6114 domain-containing protein [Nocardiopsis ganjiahuensis]|uniref:DUF6114 domain-containing protein n=1 Tax=Nocardiopsis ganjiahuensis TaxID=239984 RepID=UPI000345A0C9|nr:DUF6114 domain-containing protein [Nocardiopsis ganjiahuensis]